MSFKSNPRTKNVTTNTLKMKRRDGIFNKEKLRSKLDVEFETIQQSKAARKTCVNDKGAKINKKHQVRIKQPLKQKDLEDSISNLESLMNK